VGVNLCDVGLAVRVEQMHQYSVDSTKPYLAPEAFAGQRSMVSGMSGIGIVRHALLLNTLPQLLSNRVTFFRFA